MKIKILYSVFLLVVFIISFLPIVILAYGFLDNKANYANYNLSFLIGLAIVSSTSLITFGILVCKWRDKV